MAPLVKLRSVAAIFPSPENDELYGPVILTHPDNVELTNSVRRARQVREPLTITRDGFIVSGHRRHACAKAAGLVEVPCITLDFNRIGIPRDRYVGLLREHNRQRNKTRGQRIAEAMVDANPDRAYAAMLQERRAKLRPSSAGVIPIVGSTTRSEITAAKMPMLEAIQDIVERLKEHWPLSDRQVHYQLLNAPVLRHASKPDSTYLNDKDSYKSLTDLLTRARLAGFIPMEAIGDTTRPVDVWATHAEIGAFVTSEAQAFLRGYARDLMQSQIDHFEIIGEKNTVLPIIRPVAMQYTIPLTIGRGYCSLAPRHDLATRYRESGKRRLVLLICSDHDPDGDEIAHSFARSMRDDFEIGDIHAIKVALTPEQVRRYGLPPVMKAKETSMHHGKFTDRHGDDVFELEALSPEALQHELRNAIDGVIDMDAYNAETAAEKIDVAQLDILQRQANEAMRDVIGDEND